MKHLLLVLTLSSVCLTGLSAPSSARTSPPSVTQHNPAAQAHRNQGDKRLAAADYRGARREYQAAYALDKGKPAYGSDAGIDLRKIGNISLSQGHFSQAIASDQQALVIHQKVRDIGGQARDLTNQGIAESGLRHYPTALGYYQKALRLFQTVKDRPAEVIALSNLGNTYTSLRQYDKAVIDYQQALTLCRQIKNQDSEARMLATLGNFFTTIGQNPKAMQYFQKAAPLFQRVKDHTGQATDLALLGDLYLRLHQYDKAFTVYQKALTIDQQINNLDEQARILSSLGVASMQTIHSATAMGYFQRALPLFQQVKNQAGEVTDLNELGIASESLNQYQAAIPYYHQALNIAQQMKDPDGQAVALVHLGSASHALSHPDAAITYFQKSLPLFQRAKDRQGEATALTALGNAYDDLSQYDSALQVFQKALPLYQANKNQAGEAYVLMNLGTAYYNLSQYTRAIQYFQKAMPLFQAVKDLHGQANDHDGLGNVYEEVGQYEKAIQSYQQSLPLHQKLKDRDGEAIDLSNLAIACEDIGLYDKAIQYFQTAIPIHQQVHDRDGEASDLNNMADVYDDLGQFDSAIRCYGDALTIYRQVKDRSGEATDLDDLMMIWAHRSNPRLAVFYGKQAVNIYQSIRQNIHTMDKGIQRAYLKDKEPIYRQLAELLIAQGRLPEAEQVLNMLKNQEFFDFVRRDPNAAPTAGEASLTPMETDWQNRYQIIADHVTTIGQTKQDLLTRQQKADAGEITLTAAEKTDLQKSLTDADADLTVANKAFQDFLTQLATEFQKAPKSDQDKVQTITDATAFEDTLQQLGPGTVALYTIVEPDKVRIVMVTSQTQVARQYPIKDTDLRTKVLAFRQVLQDPTRDPRPLAHDLYTILIGPIEQDLIGAKAITLMWSLDDVLRYLPMAALYDGKQYLVERYRTAVFTPASESRLTETPKAVWNGLGLGVSKEHPGFQALTGVPQELDDVIHDPTVTASQTGALPGTILLDTAFTQAAMTQALEARKYPLVHIASHFDFQPGDETTSFLLLGDGNHLSLADIKTLPQVFQGVDLLTLSACDTATGSAGADGREVEGFAVLAQRLGAKAVIASLWPVADASTPLLMETFYRQHAAVPGQPKAEALRQAQLALLHGSISAPPTTTQRAQIVPGKSDKSASDAPPFTPDPKVPFAHPYYWAPFILIGNWK